MIQNKDERKKNREMTAGTSLSGVQASGEIEDARVFRC